MSGILSTASAKNLARVGCVSRSLVYFLVGILALLLAMGNPSGATTDESGVLRRILEQPFGWIILSLLGTGLFCYALWRFLQSVQDHDEYGRSFNGLSIRIGLFISGAAYLALGIYAVSLVLGLSRGPEFRERMMARWMLMQPMGRSLLMVLGIVVAIVGFVQFLRAFRGAFTRDLRIQATGMLNHICRFGLIARGIVFVIIGSFFIQAAWKYRSREAGGLRKAWEMLRLAPYGNYIVGLVALGFMAFAVFSLIEGFYRKRP